MNNNLNLAKYAAIEAGKLIKNKLGKSKVDQKGSSNNLVTDADTSSESLIAKILADNCPDAAILGEEAHKVSDLNIPKLWIVDPLDGTNNFAHGIPQFCVSIAYAENGEVVCGAVYDPIKDELFCAEKGMGAELNQKPIHVSANKTLPDSIVATGFSYDRGEIIDNTLNSICRLFRANIQCIRRAGSAALDLCWVACGRFDAYFEYILQPWDFAAGSLIVKEAGGYCTDREGNECSLHSKGIISSNNFVNDDFKRIVKYSVASDINNKVTI